jgi:ATP-dependent Clp protease protease subunit
LYKGFSAEEEPEKEEEQDKELRAQPDTQMLYKRMEKFFSKAAAFTCGAL